jgi:hypothetical protein
MSQVYKYKNYEHYKQIQIQANKRKIDKVWVQQDHIEFLSKYLKKNIPFINSGICHGTRRGLEQKWFREYLNCNVIGTEISPTAKKFPNTIEWDFHEVKSEWKGAIDFIYSNSFDHSYKPSECLDSWMTCIKNDGICIIEWSNNDKRSKESDPFGATEKEYEELILKKYNIKDQLILEHNQAGPITFFCIQRKAS